MSAHFIYLTGEVPYEVGHTLQQQLLALRIAGEIDDVVLLLEHASTITVGRSRGAETNVLDAGDVPVVQVARGGDVTWHGPGQLVAYPIVHLQGIRADLHLHLRSLEQSVIELLGEYGLEGVRDERNSGVWLPEAHGGAPRKVCSVGIACRKWVTWHGLALNVTPQLGAFAQINPCGFDASIMTRMADHLDHCPSVEELVPTLGWQLARALDLPPSEVHYTEDASVEAVRQVIDSHGH